MELWEEAWVCVNRWHHQVSNVILLVNHVLYCRPRPYVYTFCHNVWLWTALENPSRIRLNYVYPRPQCCVNTVLYYPSTCKSPCWHSAVSIRVPSTPLHVYILLSQCCVNRVFYYPPPPYMYKSIVPQFCANTVFYYPFTCKSPCCHSPVSKMVFTTPLHVQVFTATVLCQ